ncbi:manganese efflux pump MntP family protein [Marinifilum caeruleilacunae]|uniref:Putative manganese efflux pump MntP n=1 Tax=Marinifilum caeruleilacunae TaxID=2499076 RepID=A0ABX1WZH9_9BACT|nr:manganese efflux pump MntP family protein [Marinifilum caeruleilacunae]NOU61525.1 manganese efflux pump [Marinifilum caeruleilacunae]
MELVSIFLIALGLSVDSFAASVCSGLAIKDIKFLQAVKIAFFLALFQGGMPIIGWFVGWEIHDLIQEFDHWIAFLLLAGLGSKMIYESLTNHEEEQKFNPLKLSVLLGISVATSIDALVIGFSMALIDVIIWWPAIIIGIVTFIASMLGMLLGKKIGSNASKKFEVIGGAVLILIGLRILIEHLFFHS